jgi:peptide/nickel transport system substrate-binding protein
MDANRRKVLEIVGASLLGPAALAACRPAGQPAPAQVEPGKATKGGTFTSGTFADAATVQPLLSQDTASGAFISYHYNAPLLRRNPDTLDWETTYGTAESFQIAPDNVTYTFKLKSNLFWSDGRPITALDYLFTWEKMMDPKVEYPYRNLYRDFEGLSAPDERTLVFKLKEPYCPAIDRMIIPGPIPRHVFENLDINDNPFNQKPTVGSGPWLLKEWVKDSHAVFEANDRFYLGRPNLDRMVIRIVKDQTVAYSMLKTGEIDEATIQAQDWNEAKSLKNIQTFAYYPASASWVYIGYNIRSEFLRDTRVRQALAHALDRQKMIDAIRLGHARPMNSIYAPGSWAYTDNVTKYNFDVRKANELLDAAGWRRPPNDPSGTRVKDGKPFKIRIFYNAGNKDREQIATIAQQQFKAIGVEAEVIAEEWNAYLNRVNRTRDMELYVLGWSAGIDPDGSANIWTTNGGQNATGFSNPRVDELFPQAAKVPGCRQADRARIYQEIQKIISDDPPYIFLWENEILSGLAERIVPNKLSKLGYSYRMWEWYSKTGK